MMVGTGREKVLDSRGRLKKSCKEVRDASKKSRKEVRGGAD